MSKYKLNFDIDIDPLRCHGYARSTGRRCQMKVVPGKMVCRLHGGMSTGPKTDAGKNRIREGLRRYWSAYRAAKELAGTAGD